MRSPTAESTSIYTPASPYDDLNALGALPQVRVTAAAIVELGRRRPARSCEDYKFQQPSCFPNLSEHSTEGRINGYFTGTVGRQLFRTDAGETREITARYLVRDALKGKPELIDRRLEY